MSNPSDNAPASFALVLSNLAAVPAVVVCYRLRAYDGAALFTLLAWVSASYHLCQSNQACVADFTTLRIADYLFVYAALAWTAALVTRVRAEWRNAVVYGVLAVAVPVQTQALFRGTRISWWVPASIIGVIVLAAVVLFALVYAHHYRHRARLSGTKAPPVPPFRDYVALGVAVFIVLSSLAFFFFDGDPLTSRRYPVLHSLWHVFSMIALFLVIISRWPAAFNRKMILNKG